VSRIHAVPGTHIMAGQPVLTLTNSVLEDQLRQTQLEMRVAAERLRIAIIARAHLDIVAAEQELEFRMAVVRELSSAVEQLEVKAPCNGILCASISQPKQKLEYQNDRIATWQYHPLMMENLGARFEPGTEIGSIAPNDEVEAVILIGQEHLPDLAVDQAVRLTMDDAPGKVIRSKVTQFSREAEVFAPPGLSLNDPLNWLYCHGR